MTPFLIIGGLALLFSIAGYCLEKHPGGRSADEREAGQGIGACCWIVAAVLWFVLFIGGIARVFQ